MEKTVRQEIFKELKKDLNEGNGVYATVDGCLRIYENDIPVEECNIKECYTLAWEKAFELASTLEELEKLKNATAEHEGVSSVHFSKIEWKILDLEGAQLINN